jgi:hypothetical protein
MKKLEDIPKKNIFEVPEGYFDQLPGVIQSRVATKSSSRLSWTVSLRYALPVVIIVAVGILWFSNKGISQGTIETQLETIQDDQLTIYLNDPDLASEDLAETTTWGEDDLVELEDHVYSTLEVSSKELENALNEF